MVRQIELLLEQKPLQPYIYRDYGSLVTLGQHATLGVLAGVTDRKSFFIEGFIARQMYRSLYKMHEMALHGFWKTALGSLARNVARRTVPRVKLH